MGLQAEPPLGVGEAILNCQGSVLVALWSVHRLKQEAVKGEVLELLGGGAGLGVNELELVAFV